MNVVRRVGCCMVLFILLLPLAGAPTTVAEAPGTTPSPGGPTASAVTQLNILWAQWDPADYLATLVADYVSLTGIQVNVIQEPWSSFASRTSNACAAHNGNDFDMVIGDSQWVGQFVESGCYLELTDYMKTFALHTSVLPATLRYYAEYPPHSGRYYAFPTEGDALAWAYRKDLFESSTERAAFQATYGYALDVPRTQAQLRDIAEFFYRPAQNLYGIAVYSQKNYDAISQGFQNLLFAYGPWWADENNNPYGAINSLQAVQALERYRELWQFSPPDNTQGYYPEMNQYFTQGRVAIAMNYVAFLPALVNPASNPHASHTGFFANPPGPGGDKGASMGGQALSVNAYASAARRMAALDFIRWFGQRSVQERWGQLGGMPCHTDVLASSTFRNATPYNATYADSMAIVNDFWNLPGYDDMLMVAQTQIHRYVVENATTAQAALDTIAQDHAQVLRDHGFLQQTSAAIPTGGGTLAAPSGTTTLQVPAGALTGTATLTFTTAYTQPRVGDMSGIGHAFDLRGVYDASGDPVQPAPGLGFTIVVAYSGADVQGFYEDTLALYWWNGTAWSQQGVVSTVDTLNNTLTAQVTHLSLFAPLAERQEFDVYMPAVLKSS